MSYKLKILAYALFYIQYASEYFVFDPVCYITVYSNILDKIKHAMEVFFFNQCKGVQLRQFRNFLALLEQMTM